LQARRTEVNGQSGIMVFDPDGRLINVMTLDALFHERSKRHGIA
jgi:hypothetical protein